MTRSRETQFDDANLAKTSVRMIFRGHKGKVPLRVARPLLYSPTSLGLILQLPSSSRRTRRSLPFAAYFFDRSDPPTA